MTRALLGLSTIILFEILILFIGCQGDGNNPLTPASPAESARSETGTQDINIDETSDSHPMIWGLYQVAYNSQTHEISTVPTRGPEFALNIVQFLQPPIGSMSGMTIGVLDDSQFLITGRIDVRIILHHPFPGQDEYTGFDVCGIFLTNGSDYSTYNSSLRYADPLVDPTLVNPDGYTRWLNPAEFISGGVVGYEPGFWGTSESSENSGFVAGATLNPYKYFAFGLGPSDSLCDWLVNPTSIENRGMFPAGGTCSRDYFLGFPKVDDKIVFVFNYAILANWAPPLIDPPENPLVDFPPDANASWPQHIFATDNSNAYYTDDEAGGTINLDLEIFDWNALDNIEGVPGEINKFVIWCDETLIDGGWQEIMSTEVEWNSGFTASTALASFELEASPGHSGEIPVWIEIQSSGVNTYNQGFGAAVPDGPVCSYIQIPVNIKTCPKAGAGTVEGGDAGSGEYLDDISITGENFVDGPDLGLWLELVEGSGEAGDDDPFTIIATDINYITDDEITCDLDLSDAPFGTYGIGCTNGCGTITEPDEQPGLDPLEKFKVKLEVPLNVNLTTNRHGPEAEPLDFVTIQWTPVLEAKYYRIYAKIFDVNGNQIGLGSIIGTAASPQHTVDLDSLPNGASGIMEIWITSLPGLTPGEIPFESEESSHAFVFMQNFETGMGWWDTHAMNPDSWRLIRSTVEAAYEGDWGLKGYGHPETLQWVMLSGPSIGDLPGADTVRVEFVHRHKNFNEDNGYQAGWLMDLPTDGWASVPNYYPIPTVNEGWPYNDTDCLALREIFECTVHNDNNWQTDGNEWEGWWFSAFDYTEILGDGVDNIPVISAATIDYDHPEICIDDVAILIY